MHILFNQCVISDVMLLSYVSVVAVLKERDRVDDEV